MRLQNILTVLILVLFAFAALADAPSEFDHALFDTLLKRNVRDGMVNYRAIKEVDNDLLTRYLRQIEKVDPEEFDSWNRKAQMAFWINAYNAITIHGIVKNYLIQYGSLLSRARFPKSSIRQIKDFWDTVFVKIMGKNITLNNIEHDILRKRYGDPRIHCALVCASMSCPRLLDEAYQTEKLNEQLETVSRAFINNEEYVSLNTRENALSIAAIFSWYAEDFTRDDTVEWSKRYSEKDRGVIQFVVAYILDAPFKRDYIMQNSPKIEYIDFNWTLNELKKSH